jgi:hypothetical protein
MAPSIFFQRSHSTRSPTKATLTTIQFVDNLSYVRGKHAFKVGTNIRDQRHIDDRGSIGNFNANPVVFFDADVNRVGSAFNHAWTWRVQQSRPEFLPLAWLFRAQSEFWQNHAHRVETELGAADRNCRMPLSPCTTISRPARAPTALFLGSWISPRWKTLGRRQTARLAPFSFPRSIRSKNRNAAFPRFVAFASNLYELGADEKIVQRVLRNEKSRVTKDRHIEACDPAGLAAMTKLEATLDAMNQCALTAHQVN